MDYIDTIKKVKPSIAFLITFVGDTPVATGSGFVFWKKGILVTCNHVVKGCEKVFLKFPTKDKQEDLYVAKAILFDEEHDLALLKFDDEKHPPLVMGEIEKVEEGQEVLFSGYPLGLKDLTSHQGIISSITIDQTGITSFMLDGTVNSGNSGCPLMDKEGKVIGVVNAKRRENGETMEKIGQMVTGAVSLNGVDLVEMYQALVNNSQLGIGHAVPASYIPEHKEDDNKKIKK